MADPIKKPIDPGIVARVGQGLSYPPVVSSSQPTVRGADPSVWFGPGQPLRPVAPDVAGRRWDFPVAMNIRIRPREGELISFEQMIGLSYAYDLLRTVIETRKDQIVKVEWGIDPKDNKKKHDDRCDELENFLLFPDQEHTWQQWIRQLVEDMLVIDAATVYPRMTRGGLARRQAGKELQPGDIFSLDCMDGATIKRVIDGSGRTPLPPDVAYQQILHGVPAVDYTRDELIYQPRNLTTRRVYGYSPVEQIIVTVNIALRRQIYQLNYYKEGNVPEAIIGVPDGWSVEQIASFQEWWDNIHEGDLAQRRHARFVPGGMKYQAIKPEGLKDEMDEWLARVICYAFNVPPTPFVKQMNRATAQTVHTAALQEGLVPLLAWVKDMMNFIIWKYWGYTDLEFVWKMEEDTDPLTMAGIDDKDIRSGIRLRSQIRADRGLEDDGVPDFIMTATGPILIADIINPPEVPEVLPKVPPETPPETPETPPTEPRPGGGGKGGAKAPAGEEGAVTAPAKGKGKGEEGAVTGKLEKGSTWCIYCARDTAPGRYLCPACAAAIRPLEKKKRTVIPIDRDRKSIQTAQFKYGGDLAKILKKIGKDISSQVVDAYGTTEKLTDDEQALVEKIMEQISLDGFAVLADASEQALAAVVKDGLQAAMIQVGLDDSMITDGMYEAAVNWAQARSAEMVGKKWVEGELVDNPTAKWVIEETTRDDLRNMITQAIDEGWSTGRLGNEIEDAFAFSEARADMIARTEIKMADSAGSMIGYRESGVVSTKTWQLSNEHADDDECDENADEGAIPLDEPFPSGDDTAPGHPNCKCDVVPGVDWDKVDEMNAGAGEEE